MIEVEIDKGSGFCFGVVTAIESAERELKNTNTLYCLGDIVHNSLEVERLEKLGLRTIGHDEFTRLKGEKVLLRAHGEPPSTYEIARRNNITIVMRPVRWCSSYNVRFINATWLRAIAIRRS